MDVLQKLVARQEHRAPFRYVGGPCLTVTNFAIEGMIEAGRGLVAHLGDRFSGYGRLEALVVAYYE